MYKNCSLIYIKILHLYTGIYFKTQKLQENFTNIYKEMASNLLN